MTPEKFVSTTLMKHEGKLSMDPDDSGNWFDRGRYRRGLGPKRGRGELVGSKYGVTAHALANFLKVDCVTKETMVELNRDVAIAIALEDYYRKPKIETLEPYTRVHLAVLDMAYNAGPTRAIKLLQAAIGAAADGKLGPQTRRMFKDYVLRFGEEQLMVSYTHKRKDYYRSLRNRKYEKGWIRRADSFLPGTSWWSNAGS